MIMCKSCYGQLAFVWSKTQKSEALSLSLLSLPLSYFPFLFSLFPFLHLVYSSQSHMVCSLFLFFKVCRTGDLLDGGFKREGIFGPVTE